MSNDEANAGLEQHDRGEAVEPMVVRCVCQHAAGEQRGLQRLGKGLLSTATGLAAVAGVVVMIVTVVGHAAEQEARTLVGDRDAALASLDSMLGRYDVFYERHAERIGNASDPVQAFLDPMRQERAEALNATAAEDWQSVRLHSDAAMILIAEAHEAIRDSATDVPDGAAPLPVALPLLALAAVAWLCRGRFS